MGSVKTATNEYGTREERYEYDAFGQPYTGDLTQGMSLGYTGKSYDTTTGLYNYGYRDYKPEAARFTTVDPIRDGANWFVYVNNDPVNWVDWWGLRPLTQEERAAYVQATGHSIDFDKIDVREDEMPTVQDVRNAAASVGADHSTYSDAKIQQAINRPGIDAISLPDGRIYTKM
jgi:RHS repeat-associated protein